MRCPPSSSRTLHTGCEAGCEALPAIPIGGGWFPVKTATLDPPVSAGTRYVSRGVRWSGSDEDMYVAVARAWCRMFSREERRKYPLRPYVLGRGFAKSAADAPIDGLRVASVCARLACRHMHQRGRGESSSLKRLPHHALDPAVAWWCALDEPDGLGLHYVELGGGTLEFLSVAHRHDRPDTESSR